MTAEHLHTLSDEELIVRSAEKNQIAFEILVNRYLKVVFNFIRHFGGVYSDDADDITQDTFFKVWKSAGKFDENKKFKTWILTIAKNTLFDHLKKKRALPFSDLGTEDDSETASNISDDNFSLMKELEDASHIEFISNKIETLQPNQKAVLMLHYEQEMTFEEIASVLNKPMNTVKSWHRRAIAEIKTLLKNR